MAKERGDDTVRFAICKDDPEPIQFRFICLC